MNGGGNVGKYTKSSEDTANRISQALAVLAVKIDEVVGTLGKRSEAALDLELYRVTAPTVPVCCSYEPSLLVVAQGQKRVELGKSSYSFGENMFLLTSLELPVISQVAVASKEKPYLAFFLKLDIATARDILNTEEVDVRETPVGPGGMAIGHSTVEIISCCSRILDLLDSPKDMHFMGKLLRREMTYRLLQSSQGARLRAIATLGDQNNRSAKAVAWLRANYQKPLNIDTLADLAGMGRSTLHHHFRALTAMSPLQFQKQLRLHAARQRMLLDEVDATSAAYEVGYESANQFNREYRRYFGSPPMRDVQALRMTDEKLPPA
jgi:AraC-like DNA-binding protein